MAMCNYKRLSRIIDDNRLTSTPRQKMIVFALMTTPQSCSVHEKVDALADLADAYNRTFADKNLGEDERDRTLQGMRGEWNEALDDLEAAFPDLNALARAA